MKTSPPKPLPSFESVPFDGHNAAFAKEQDEYRTLYSFKYPADPYGTVVFCWKIRWADRLRILLGRPIYHTVLTFNRKLQPMNLSLNKPDLDAPAANA